LALHDPPLHSPFINEATGLVSKPWIEWLIITKRDKIDAVDDATDGNIPTFDEDGHLEDSGSSVSTIIIDIAALQAADVLLQAKDLALEAQSYYYALTI